MLITNLEECFAAAKIRHIVGKYGTRKEDKNELQSNYTNPYY